MLIPDISGLTVRKNKIIVDIIMCIKVSVNLTRPVFSNPVVVLIVLRDKSEKINE